MKLKLKLTRTILLLIIAGICFIASVALSLVCSQQVQQQSQLKAKLASDQSNLKGVQLEQLSSQQAELEKQLSQATSQFGAVNATLSRSIGSTAVSNTFFDVAKANGLEVTEITSPGLSKDTLGKVTCSSILLRAKVEGNISNLVSFVTKLTSSFVTNVKSVTITTAARVEEPAAAGAGGPAPDFQLQNLDGQIISLSEFRGKPVLINFWATWCPSCQKELSVLNNMYAGLVKEGIEVFAINVGEFPDTVENFIESYSLAYRVLLDKDTFVARAFQTGVPSYVLIDKKGQVVFRDDYFPYGNYKDLILEPKP